MRKYLPTLAELVDRLSIVQLKEVFITEHKEEYAKDSFEYSIPNSFILTVATAETGNMEFKGAPTAKEANNFFGVHPTEGDDFLPTKGGSKLAKYETPKEASANPIATINITKTGNQSVMFPPYLWKFSQAYPLFYY